MALSTVFLVAACGGEPAAVPASAQERPKYLSAAATVLTLPGQRKDYKIIKTSSGWTVTGLGGSKDYARLDLIQFADLSVSFTIDARSRSITPTDLNSIIELYVAYFNRLPDADGLGYWAAQRLGGMSVNDIGTAFYAAAIQYSPLTGYSASMSNADFIAVLYKNVLGRASVDADGLKYWTGLLQNGEATRGTVVKRILDTAHTYKGDKDYGWVADLLDNKVALAKRVAIQDGISFLPASQAITNGTLLAQAITPTGTGAAIVQLQNLGVPEITDCSGDTVSDYTLKFGPYELSNSKWGASNVPANIQFTQCTSGNLLAENTFSGEWEWHLPKWDGTVINGSAKSYPALTIGQPFFMKRSSSGLLPMMVSKDANLVVNYDITHTNDTGMEAIAADLTFFDISFSTGLPANGAVPTPLLDIAVSVQRGLLTYFWLTKVETVEIGGAKYDVYWSPSTVSPKGTVFFNIYQDTFKTSLRIKPITDYLVSRGYLDPAAYITSIDFGTEVAAGSGKVVVNSYSVKNE